MEAKYWVPKSEVTYDSIGNENKGVYRSYIVELTLINVKGEVGFTYIEHTELFDREFYSWENSEEFILKEEPDLSNWKQVSKDECSEPDNWTFFSLDKIKPKKMFKYVESFDDVEEQ